MPFFSRHGSTLFEVLGALLFALVVAAVSVPRVGPLLRQASARAPAEMLEAVLREVQLESIQLRRERTVRILETSYEWARGEERVSRTLPEGCTIAASSAEFPAEVHFYPSGAASPLTLTVHFPADACRITIALRGRITNSCRRSAP